MRAAVLGAGYMGSAVTFPLCDAGWEVRLWGTWLDDEIIERCRHHNHPKLKKRLPEKIGLYGSLELEAAIEDADIVFIAVTSEGFVPVFERYLTTIAEKERASHTGNANAGLQILCKRQAPYRRQVFLRQAVCALTKGFVRYRGRVCLISEAAEKIYGATFDATEGIRMSGGTGTSSGLRWISIGGPVKAVELCNRIPTATVYATRDGSLKEIIAAIETGYYRICMSEDLCGVELSSALKNIYAIGVGICDGMHRASSFSGLYHNYKALLFNQALREMALLVQTAGGRRETVFDLAGIGDLYVTSASGRNGRFGGLVGEGVPAQEAYNAMIEQGEYTEGYNTLKLGYEFVEDLGTCQMKSFHLIKGLPLLKALYEIIFRGNECGARMQTVLSSIGIGR